MSFSPRISFMCNSSLPCIRRDQQQCCWGCSCCFPCLCWPLLMKSSGLRRCNLHTLLRWKLWLVWSCLPLAMWSKHSWRSCWPPTSTAKPFSRKCRTLCRRYKDRLFINAIKQSWSTCCKGMYIVVDQKLGSDSILGWCQVQAATPPAACKTWVVRKAYLMTVDPPF